MKTVVYRNNERNRDNNPLHVEVPGAIVNIYVGLKDDSGQDVTRVNIIADDYAGEEWRIEDGEEMLTSLSARVISVPGYRKQQHVLAEKMKIEASHMTKVEPGQTDPDFMTCVRDLLGHIFDKADEALPKEWDVVLMAAERVEAAMEYDKPVVEVEVTESGMEITNHPDWIIIETTNGD